jgi:hypothetical protein
VLVAKFGSFEVCTGKAGCVAAFHVLNALEGLDHVWRWCRRSYDFFFPSLFFPGLNFNSKI